MVRWTLCEGFFGVLEGGGDNSGGRVVNDVGVVAKWR